MKVLIRQFLGKNHSWSVCGWGIAKSLIKQGHSVDLFSTDGIKNLPEDLKNNIIGYHEENDPNNVVGLRPSANYDCQISYTAMKNFPINLGNGSKNRFGIWCYEWAGKNVLPNGFAKHYKSCDKLITPSNFTKQVFIDSGIPASSIEVVAHGVEDNYFNSNSTMTLPTNKSFKILSNIAQNHLRKNIPGLLSSFGKAFTNKDDVCLILKAKHKPVKNTFDISLDDCLSNFYKKYPNHAEIKVMSNFIPDMSELYRSVDAVFSLSYCEGYLMPMLESIASGKLAIAPNWGGQLDFLNNDNALLISGKEVRADPKSMYWESKSNAIWFDASTDDAADKLQYAYKNYKTLNSKIELNKHEIQKNHSWDTITNKILGFCK